MGKVLIPDECLSNQICEECFKYLSVEPISVTSSGSTICGRCAKTSTDNSLKTSLYNIVAQSCVFKCINHYEGCDKLLQFNDVENHEKTCSFPVSECNNCSFNGIGSQLIQHYKIEHPTAIIEDEMFQFDLKQGKYFGIYWKFEKIFLVELYNDDENNYIIVSYLRKGNAKVGCSFQIFGADMSDCKVRYVTKKKSFNKSNKIKFVTPLKDLKVDKFSFVYVKIVVSDFEDVVHDKLSVLNKLQLELMEREKMLEENERKVAVIKSKLKIDEVNMQNSNSSVLSFLFNNLVFTLNCIACSNPVLSNNNKMMYHCPANHVCCTKCLKSLCVLCNKICDWLPLPLDGIKLPCFWKNCDQQINISNHVKHAQMCCFKMFKCPIYNCSWSGYLADFLEHWHTQVPSLVHSNDLNLVLTVGDYVCYWLVPNCNQLKRVTVKIIKTKTNNLDLSAAQKTNSGNAFGITSSSSFLFNAKESSSSPFGRPAPNPSFNFPSTASGTVLVEHTITTLSIKVKDMEPLSYEKHGYQLWQGNVPIRMFLENGSQEIKNFTDKYRLQMMS